MGTGGCRGAPTSLSEIGYLRPIIPPSLIDPEDNTGWADGTFPFETTAVALPQNSNPIVLTISSHDEWRNEQEPMGGEPEIAIRLSEEVIVLPVAVRIFAGENYEPPYAPNPRLLSEGMMMSYFDPGRAVVDNIVIVDDGNFTQYNVEQREDNGVDLDLIWSQCDIQFSLVSYEIYPQGLDLENVLVTEGECDSICDTGDTGVRMHEFLQAESPTWFQDAIPVIFGGTIDGACSGEDGFGLTNIEGVTCRSNGCIQAYPNDFVAIDASRYFAHDLDKRKQILAHELGHYLGLRHTKSYEPISQCGMEINVDSENLMIGGQVAARTRLTADQCLLARCHACERLNLLGLAAQNGACGFAASACPYP